MSIPLHLARSRPGNETRPVEDDAYWSPFGPVQNDQVFRLMAYRNAGSLRELDLDRSAIRRLGVVPQRRSWIEIEVEDVGGDDFADTAYQVAIQGELAAWEQRFKTFGRSVEVFEIALDLRPVDIMIHVSALGLPFLLGAHLHC